MSGPAVEHVAVAAALEHRDVAVHVGRGEARGLGAAAQREQLLERDAACQPNATPSFTGRAARPRAARRVEQRERALRVAELAAPDHLERARERHLDHLDHLVGLVAHRHRLEVEGGEEVDHLVGEARRGQDRAERLEPAGAAAGLLLELVPRADVGRVAVELAGRHLPDRAARRVAELADQQHVALGDSNGTTAEAPGWRTMSSSTRRPFGSATSSTATTIERPR